MNPHFFTAPFYFAFIGFRVQGSRGGFAAIFDEGIPVSTAPLAGNAIKLSGRTSWPPSGELPEGLRGLRSGIA